MTVHFILALALLLVILSLRRTHPYVGVRPAPIVRPTAGRRLAGTDNAPTAEPTEPVSSLHTSAHIAPGFRDEFGSVALGTPAVASQPQLSSRCPGVELRRTRLRGIELALLRTGERHTSAGSRSRSDGQLPPAIGQNAKLTRSDRSPASGNRLQRLPRPVLQRGVASSC